MEALPNRKITVVKVTEASPQRNLVSRSPSPYKSYASTQAPAFRPKAKVNSSATPANVAARKATSVISSSALSRTSSVKSSVSTSTSRTAASNLTPRSGSPSKSPVPRPRATVTRGVTARVAGPQEARRGSLTGNSNQPYASRSAESSSPVTVSALLDLSDDEQPSPVVSPRITSKLSRRNSNEFPPSPPLPPNSSLRAESNRPRVHSISSNASSSSAPFYPNSPPTNPHRFPTTVARASPPSTGSHYYQPFPRDDAVRYPRTNGFTTAKVDPAAIPLPPHSPPTSAVSFSSRSSRSPSSVSYATESGTSQLSAPRTGNSSARDGADSSTSMRSGLENLMHFSGMMPTTEDGEDDSDEDDDEQQQEESRELLRASTVERKVRAEAKSVRKIADLEITNRSLLTINTSLEQTKHRQAKEIRELRRKLRESRLILPPRAFRAVKSSLDHDDTADSDEDDEDDEPEEGEEAEKAEKAREAHDVTYRRIKVILEGLLESGRRALETTPQDFPEPVKVTKVLSAYEVPQHLSDDDEQEPAGAATPASPSHVAMPDSDDVGMSSEDEVEAMTLPRDSPPPSHPPSPRAPASEIEPA